MMHRIYEIFLVFILIVLSSGASWAVPIRIAVFGDSLTSGYKLQANESFPVKLEAKLKYVGFDNFEVVNMSVPGETTAGALERLNSLTSYRPDIVLVELGSNDAIRGINVEIISNNLSAILGKLKQDNVYIILMGAKAPPSQGYNYSARFDQLYPFLAKHYQVALYPFTLEGVYGNPDLNLADGYHPNGKGVDIIVEGVYRMVDAGLRWKYQVRQQQMEYQRQLQNSGQSQQTIDAMRVLSQPAVK